MLQLYQMPSLNARKYWAFSQILRCFFVYHIVSQRCKWVLGCPSLCYNGFMNIGNITDVVALLRVRLEPVESADKLSDAVEGQLPDARKAAVLLGIFEHEREASIVFIRRAATLRAHSGEIAFPGGGVDPTDSSPVMAALREAQEEIGLDPSRVEVLGILHPVFTAVSNYLIV